MVKLGAGLSFIPFEAEDLACQVYVATVKMETESITPFGVSRG